LAVVLLLGVLGLGAGATVGCLAFGRSRSLRNDTVARLPSGAQAFDLALKVRSVVTRCDGLTDPAGDHARRAETHHLK
jgi:hypothetical protein